MQAGGGCDETDGRLCLTEEGLYTKHEFREVFEKHAADIINPDICNCGGILDLKEIVVLDEEALARHAYQHFPARRVRQPADEELYAFHTIR